MTRFFHLLLSVVACAAISVPSLASSRRVVERAFAIVGPIEGIKTSNMAHVVYVPTNSSVVTVRASMDERLLPYLRVELFESNLIVKFKDLNDKDLQVGEDDVVFVSAPSVPYFEASTLSSIKVQAPLTASGKVEAITSSLGRIDLGQLSCDNIKVVGSSAGSVEADQVRCKSLNLRGSSAAVIQMDNAQCDILVVNGSSASTITLGGQATTSGQISISSAATLRADGMEVASLQGSVSSQAQASISAYSSSVETSSGGRLTNTARIRKSQKQLTGSDILMGTGSDGLPPQKPVGSDSQPVRKM